MRWLYVPNEVIEGDQIGPRMAFEKLSKDGVFSAYKAYSYLVHGKLASCHSDALNHFLFNASNFDPDVIFIQHPNNGYPMDRLFLQRLKSIKSKPKLVLYEEDPYHRFTKKFDNTLKAVFAESDICFISGTGDYADMARTAGAKKIRHTNHSYDSQRFGIPWIPTLTRSYDAVMIANLPCLKRIPWLFLPGGRSRKITARLLNKELGERFALYGSGQGWRTESYCKGNISFNQQGEVVRNAWMSVNWGQFDEIPMYSSDRLPISLACGVPHITNYQSGYEYIFDRVPGLFTVKSPQEVLDVALYILSLTVERRNELGFLASEYAIKHLEATVVYSDIVSVAQEVLFERLSGREYK